MARIRTVKPEYWEDEATGALSYPARLLDVGMRNHADDEGLLRWTPDFLRGALFRYDADATADRVATWMREVEQAGIVFVYSSTRVRWQIAFIIGFREGPLAQRIDKPQPSRQPVPNWRDPAVVMVYARRDNFTCRHCGEPVNERFSQAPEASGLNPVCERIKPPSEKFHYADDPSNIAVVHAMCAKQDPEGRGDPFTTIPGTFREGSANGPGVVAERSGDAFWPGTPTAQNEQRHYDERELPPEPDDHVSAGQSIPGTFVERSAQESRGKERSKESKEQPPAPADALFPVDTTDAEPATERAPKRAAKKTTSAKRERSELEVIADGLTKAFYDKHKERLTQPYVALLKIIRVPIKNGVDRNALAFALDLLATEGTAISGGTIRTALTRVEQHRAPARTNEPGGKVIPFAPHRGPIATTDARLAQVDEATEEAKRMLARLRRDGRTG